MIVFPVYICEKCGCIDNTACGGSYWYVSGKMDLYLDPWYNEHAVCRACMPEKYHDGTENKERGWHGRFEKKHWSKYGPMKDQLKYEKRKDGTKIYDVINAKKYFKLYGEHGHDEFIDDYLPENRGG